MSTKKKKSDDVPLDVSTHKIYEEYREIYEKIVANNKFDSVKLATVGDEAVGKTCMLISYHEGSFPLDFVPTVMGTLNA